MIPQSYRDKWKKQDKERQEEVLKIAKEEGIPEEDIQKMFTEINAKTEELIHRLDKNGFFDET